MMFFSFSKLILILRFLDVDYPAAVGLLALQMPIYGAIFIPMLYGFTWKPYRRAYYASVSCLCPPSSREIKTRRIRSIYNRKCPYFNIFCSSVHHCPLFSSSFDFSLAFSRCFYISRSFYLKISTRFFNIFFCHWRLSTRKLSRSLSNACSYCSYTTSNCKSNIFIFFIMLLYFLSILSRALYIFIILKLFALLLLQYFSILSCLNMFQSFQPLYY